MAVVKDKVPTGSFCVNERLNYMFRCLCPYSQWLLMFSQLRLVCNILEDLVHEID